jgi:hypothetical protein
MGVFFRDTKASVFGGSLAGVKFTSGNRSCFSYKDFSKIKFGIFGGNEFEAKELQRRSVAHLLRYMRSNNCVIISGVSDKEDGTEKLKVELDKLGKEFINFAPVDGRWKEGDKVFEPEPSFLVIGGKKVGDVDFVKRMKKLGKDYNQRAILITLLTGKERVLAGYIYCKEPIHKATWLGELVEDNIEERIERLMKINEGAGYSEKYGQIFLFYKEGKTPREDRNLRKFLKRG